MSDNFDKYGPDWEKGVVRDSILMLAHEQRAKRRWSVFFRLIFIGIFISLIYSWTSGPSQLDSTPASNLFSNEKLKAEKHLALIEMKGIIQDDQQNISFSRFSPIIAEAFENDKALAVIIHIDSPGGSPVQSDLLHQQLVEYKKEYDKELYVVVGEIAASGGYYIASAADNIIVNRHSLIGSIGVISAGFGFVDLLEKVGVERRVNTAGPSKNLADPFLPENIQSKELIRGLLTNAYDIFVSVVKEGRENKLALNNEEEIFSGAIFTAQHAKDLGLVDGFGSVETISQYLELDTVTYREQINFEDFFSNADWFFGSFFRELQSFFYELELRQKAQSY